MVYRGFEKRNYTTVHLEILLVVEFQNITAKVFNLAKVWLSRRNWQINSDLDGELVILFERDNAVSPT